MDINELRSAIAFGAALIDDCKDDGKEVPTFVYERMIELQAQLIKALDVTESSGVPGGRYWEPEDDRTDEELMKEAEGREIPELPFE